MAFPWWGQFLASMGVVGALFGLGMLIYCWFFMTPPAAAGGRPGGGIELGRLRGGRIAPLPLAAVAFLLIFLTTPAIAQPQEKSRIHFVFNASHTDAMPSEDDYYYDFTIVDGARRRQLGRMAATVVLSEFFSVLGLESGGIPNDDEYHPNLIMTQEEGFLITTTLTVVDLINNNTLITSPAQALITSEEDAWCPNIPNADQEYFYKNSAGINWNLQAVVNQSYLWVEGAIALCSTQADLKNWPQLAFRDGLLECGVVDHPYNGYSLDQYLLGTKIGGSTFDSSGRRRHHSAADLLSYAKTTSNVRVDVHASTVEMPGFLQSGNDVGTQCRSGICFYTPDQQEKAALESKDRHQKKLLNRAIVTEILPAKKFYRAEEYHQQYLEKGGKIWFQAIY